MQKPPKLEEYNGKGDPDEHVELVNDRPNYYSADDTSRCKLLTLTLVRLTRLWFNSPLDNCIKSWANFCDCLITHFTTRKMQLVTIAALSSNIQGEKEILRSYIDRFNQVTI